MSASSIRMTKARKVSIAGIAAAGAAAITLSLVPSNGSSADQAAVKAAPVAWSAEAASGKPAALTIDTQSAFQTKVEAAVKAAAKVEADAKTQADLKAKAAAEAAVKERTVAKPAVSRSAAKPVVAQQVAATVYPNNLDGWIREALSIMKKEGIPGSYDGLHRNIMRESSGNPRAINNWDINAKNGVPSKGLLQVIQPTFNAYHVAGTPFDLYHPVSNIVAAANYAADRYGSIDNVFGAY
ncbi:transglycosylase SLT domain-containing protein [Streptomyces sp. NPDC057638]|uniref:transglycosylase SLT domain-containing protein n=1 Tax=Streptomyces sp. NPDC057638 TaxID=3346190 RepID=UPI0036C078E9